MSRLAGLKKRAPHKGALFVFWLLLFQVALLPLEAAEAGPCLPFRADEWAGVSHVYDGDTVRLSDGRKVRLIGINAPEIGHGGEPSEPLGEEARQALQKLLAGQTRIAMRYDSERKDHYGRLLAHLYLADQRNIQEQLLGQGLAAAVAIAPNLANLDCYLAAEGRAKGRGIWRQPRFSPYEIERLPATARGFYIVQGTVERIGESRKSLWLNFAKQGESKVAVRIDKDDLAYFEGAIDPRELRGKKIRVRGWLSGAGDKRQIWISHPASIMLLDH